MAIIALPPELKIRRSRLILTQPSQVNEGQWSGVDQVEAEPWHGRWSGEFETKKCTEAEAEAVFAFLVQLKGRANRCRLPASKGPQHSGSLSVVANSGVGAIGTTSIGSSGWPASSTTLGAGKRMTIADQLVVLTAPAAANASGQAVLTFLPALRVLPANGAAIEVTRPTMMAALAEPDVALDLDVIVSGFSFSVRDR